MTNWPTTRFPIKSVRINDFGLTQITYANGYTLSIGDQERYPTKRGAFRRHYCDADTVEVAVISPPRGNGKRPFATKGTIVPANYYDDVVGYVSYSQLEEYADIVSRLDPH